MKWVLYILLVLLAVLLLLLLAAVIRAALARRTASIMIRSSIRLSLGGLQVG